MQLELELRAESLLLHHPQKDSVLFRGELLTYLG